MNKIKNIFSYLANLTNFIFIILITAFLLTGFLSGCKNSAGSETGRDENILLVGSDTTYPPFEYMEDGSLTGFDIDLINEVAKRMGKEIEISSVKWDPEFKDLRDGKLDMIISAVQITEDKEGIVDFSDPYFTLEYLMISLSESEIKIKEDLAGKNIGVLKIGMESLDEDYLLNYKVSVYEDIMVMLEDLKNKKIEAILISLPLSISLLRDNNEMYMVLDRIKSKKEFGIVFNEGSILREEINAILKEINADGTYQNIFDKWFNYNV